ncbi:regulator of RNase E activity RraA [Variovorax sp. TBS-050B]|uniref:RraA family protein n=1 Tax=Variovorax sp. TBS-050B TaxID=2940551 RepID=UPI002475D2F8|nr:RraA family protein [Variovorax sp. TBS-050B]MDH6592489.1 regulator of RNase E activity RraA [Variovorax sp. TBS-050B]
MIGFRILQRRRAVSADTVARFRELPVANVSDVMNRMTAGGARLRPLHRGGAMAGAALTVKTRPGDNLMIHKALDLAQPGDVVVVDGGGDLSNSLIGELMISHAKVRGIAGLVLWGAVRDLAWIRAQELPVFAAGVSHRGPYKDGPGEINVPIAIEGMVIEPGDLLLGDDDGVLCVPHAQTEAVFRAATAKHQQEEKKMRAILAGEDDRRWIDAALERGGCEREGSAAS